MSKILSMPDVSGLLKAVEVILDPVKAVEMATAFKVHIDNYQSLVDQYKEWKSIEDFRNAADSKMADANAKQTEAAAALAKAKAEAEERIKSSIQREFSINKRLRDREQSLTERESKVADTTRELDKLRDELVSRETQARQRHSEAVAMMARAQAIAEDYQQRLEKLKGLAA